MPFEFTGERPTLQGTPASFASFATSSGQPTPKATPSFGGFGSFGFSAPSKHSQDTASTSGTRTPPASTKNDILPAGSDPLSKALRRTLQQQTVFFGASDLGGDALLKQYVSHLERSDGVVELSRDLAKELATLGEQHPLSKSLLHFLFDKAAIAEGAKPTPKTSAAPALQKSEAPSAHPHYDEKALKTLLVPQIHSHLGDMGWAPTELHRTGYIQNAKAQMVCHLALACTDKSRLATELFEEDIGGVDAQDPCLLGLVDWVTGLVADAKETQRRENEAAAEAAGRDAGGEADASGHRGLGTRQEQWGPHSNPLWGRDEDDGDKARSEYSQGHDSDDASEDDTAEMTPREKLDALLAGGYVAPGYYGKEWNREWDASMCCKKHAEKQAEAQKLSNAQRAAQLSRTHSPTVQDTEDDPEVFRFMDLPPELRTWVYRAILVPGEVRLISCVNRKRLGAKPSLSLGILRASQQINHEAKGLLYENRFITDAACVSAPSWMIDQKLLPHHVLPRLTHLTLTLSAFAQSNEWRQLRAMTGLEQLTICGTRHESEESSPWPVVLVHVIESVPKACVLKLEPSSDMEKAHCEQMVERLNGIEWRAGKVLPCEESVMQADLHEAEKTAEKGCMSGQCGFLL